MSGAFFNRPPLPQGDANMPFSPGLADLAVLTMVDLGQAGSGIPGTPWHPRSSPGIPGCWSAWDPDPYPQHAAGHDLPSRCVHRWGFIVCVFLVRRVRSPKEPRSAQKIRSLRWNESVNVNLSCYLGSVWSMPPAVSGRALIPPATRFPPFSPGGICRTSFMSTSKQ